jgi:hypothetical protein
MAIPPRKDRTAAGDVMPLASIRKICRLIGHASRKCSCDHRRERIVKYAHGVRGSCRGLLGVLKDLGAAFGAFDEDVETFQDFSQFRVPFERRCCRKQIARGR